MIKNKKILSYVLYKTIAAPQKKNYTSPIAQALSAWRNKQTLNPTLEEFT